MAEPQEAAPTSRAGREQRFELTGPLAGHPLLVVEIDPCDPTSMPRKHTALGRFKHSAAVPVIAGDRRMVVYSGDDAPLECAYKFVTDCAFDPFDRRSNLGLFERGTLYAAKFRPDGGGEWLPLVYGTGPLTEAHGFHSQAEVLVDTRRAADLLGATRMARPEAIEVSTATNQIQIALVRPRCCLVRIEEELGDHSALRFRWQISALPLEAAAEDLACGRRHRAPGGAGYEVPRPEPTILGS